MMKVKGARSWAWPLGDDAGYAWHANNTKLHCFGGFEDHYYFYFMFDNLFGLLCIQKIILVMGSILIY